MANIKSSKKAIKVIAKKTEANHEYIKQAKNLIKNCDKAINDNDFELASKLLKDAKKSIDKATSKGLFKKNTADRQKSRLSKKVKEMK